MWTYPWNVENTSVTASRGPAGYYPATSTSYSGAGFLSLWDFGTWLTQRNNSWGQFPPPYPPWPNDSIPGGVSAPLATTINRAVSDALTALQAAPTTPIQSTRNGEPTLTYPDGKLVFFDRVNEVFYQGITGVAPFDKQLLRYQNLLDAVQRALKAQLSQAAGFFALDQTLRLEGWAASYDSTTGNWLLSLEGRLGGLNNVLASRLADVGVLVAKYAPGYNLAAASKFYSNPSTTGTDMAIEMLVNQMRLTGLVNDGVMALAAWKAAVDAIDAFGLSRPGLICTLPWEIWTDRRTANAGDVCYWGSIEL